MSRGFGLYCGNRRMFLVGTVLVIGFVSLLQISVSVAAQSGHQEKERQAGATQEVTRAPRSAAGPAIDENAYCGKGNVPKFGAKDGPAELPKACYYTAMDGTPAPGKRIKVSSGSDLEQEVQHASCGDTLLLPAGESFKLKSLPRKNCDDQHYIVIRTDAPDSKLPAENQRVSPAWAGVASLPDRPAYAQPPGGPARLLATIIVSDPDGVRFGDHYRFIGLEWTKTRGSNVGRLAFAGEADHLIFDRNWFHGWDGEEMHIGLGMAKGAHYIAIIHSYFSSFTCTAVTGSCTDAVALGGGNGNLPIYVLKVVDNFLEASGENILMGGAAATVRPEDLEIRRNHLFKPMFWNPGSPDHRDPTPIVKNLFELKNGNRVLFEGNYLENSWGGFSQVGPAILLTPRNQANRKLHTNLCPTCAVTNITIRYDWIRNVNQVLQIANPSDFGEFASGGNSYSIHDIVAEGLGYKECTRGCGGATLQIAGGSPKTPASDVMHDVSLTHMTLVSNGYRRALMAMQGPPPSPGAPQMHDIIFNNNIAEAGEYGPWATGGTAEVNCSLQPHVSPKLRIENCWDGGSSFRRNVVAGGASIRQGKDWPDDNFFPGDQGGIGFVNLHGGVDGDYHLAASSKYKGKGTDGKDPGADIDAVLEAIHGVR